MEMNTMSLVGGLLEYGTPETFGERYESADSPKGRKVRFLNDNGYDSEREHASKLFKTGQILTVKEIYVGTFSSTVEFIEYPKEQFNTVMFCDV